MTEQNDQDNFEVPEGGFVAGFSIGLVAGAAAYFLFGTERGTKLRSQLMAEWESATDQMVDDGVIEDAQISLRGFLQDLVEDIFQTSLPTEIMSPNRSKKHSRSSANAKKSKPRTSKFSGV